MPLATLAAVSAAFNLVCSGTVSTTTALGSNSEPYSTIYRLDLSGNKWCEGDCKFVRSFATISDSQLMLESKNLDTPRSHEMLLNLIARDNGAHTINAVSGIGAGAVVMKWQGVCEKSAFTGFPTPITKF